MQTRILFLQGKKREQSKSRNKKRVDRPSLVIIGNLSTTYTMCLSPQKICYNPSTEGQIQLAAVFFTQDTFIQESIPLSLKAQGLVNKIWNVPFLYNWRDSLCKCLFQQAKISWLYVMVFQIFLSWQSTMESLSYWDIILIHSIKFTFTVLNCMIFY